MATKICLRNHAVVESEFPLFMDALRTQKCVVVVDAPLRRKMVLSVWKLKFQQQPWRRYHARNIAKVLRRLQPGLDFKRSLNN